MEWVKVETGFPRHPKLDGLSASIKWHYLELWCYAAEFETDGVLPTKIVRTRCREALTNAHLLERLEDGFLLVGFLAHNPSKASLQANREKGRERVKRYRNAVTDPPRNAVTTGVSNVVPRGTEVEGEVEEEIEITQAVDVTTDEDDPSLTEYDHDPFLNGQPTAPVLNMKEIA